MALRNTGAALCDYAQGEVENFKHPHLTRSPPLPVLTNFRVQPPLPIPKPQWLDTMPVVSSTKKSGRKMNNGVIIEEEKKEEYNGADLSGGKKAAAVDETPSPLLQTPVVGIEEDDDVIHEEEDHHLQLQQNLIKRRGITVNSAGGVMDVRLWSVNLLKILGEIGDYFLKAFESVQEVSEIEATRLHYCSNFASNQGHFGHAARAMPMTAWNRSFRGAPNGENGNDEEKYETYVTVLDKLIAGEKKLYEGVKFFPRLVALVDGMSKMWDSMCEHHGNQLKVVTYLNSLDVSRVLKETTEHHHEQTVQLYNVVQSLHSNFETLVTHQKKYVQALDNWLKLNLVSNESSLKEKVSSPSCVQTPPIKTLLHLWLDHLQKLRDEHVKCAIVSFAAVIETIMNHREEEMKLNDRCDELRKEYFRETHAFENWYHEYLMERSPQDEMDLDQVTVLTRFLRRRFVVETLKKKFKDETEAHQKLCVQVRENALGGLKIRFPELFRAMLDYAHVCRDLYQRLRSIVHSQNH